MNASHVQVLKSLTTRSSLAMLLRTLYRMGLDYCVLPPDEDFSDVIVFTKDQLVSLIERTSPETPVIDISRRVAQGMFKPVAIFKSDSSSGDFVAKAGFTEPEQLQVLLIEDEGSDVISLEEALRPRLPDFPEWWEAPVPFAMCGRGKLHVNHTAMLMFGLDLKHLSIDDLPDRNEFLVALEGGPSSCTVTFRRLEGDIFMLEDSTSDIAAAEDITWWAAVGKAWLASLDREERPYWRHDAAEDAELEALAANGALLPCEWEGKLLGYLHVEEKKAAPPRRRASAESQEEAEKGKSKRRRTVKKGGVQKGAKARSAKAKKEEPKKEDENLKMLGPQALGLLVPGSRFTEEGGGDETDA